MSLDAELLQTNRNAIFIECISVPSRPPLRDLLKVLHKWAEYVNEDNFKFKYFFHFIVDKKC